MNPLTVTFSPFIYTDIGKQNLNSLINYGFNNILLRPNGDLYRKLSRISLEALGDNFLPFVYGVMSCAFRFALQMDIKLVFYAENGEAEYGGSSGCNDIPSRKLEDFLEVYFKGVSIDDLVEWGLQNNLLSHNDYSEADLSVFRLPHAEEFKRKGVQMHWLSYYLKWTPQENYYFASEHTGFKANPERSDGTYSKYASLDDRTDALHYYFGYLKFGLGRATSDAAHEIRDGHITREEGVALVKRYDGELPHKYFKECLDYLDLSDEKFNEIVDKFRTPHLWRYENGEWSLRKTIY